VGVKLTSLSLGAAGIQINPGSFPLQTDGVLFATGPNTVRTDSPNFSWDQTGFRVTTTNGFRSGNGSAATPAFSFSTQTGFGWYRSAAGEMALSDGAGGRASYLTSGSDFFLLSDTATFRLGVSSDVILTRGGANRLALRNGTNAQRSDIYNTLSGADSELFSVRWAANECHVETSETGAGTSRAIRLGSVGAAPLALKTVDTDRWYVLGSGVPGALIAAVDNTYDIGLSAAFRPREIFAATGYRGPSNVAGFSGTVAPVATITVSGGIVTNVA
jgi:hypothetical protein